MGRIIFIVLLALFGTTFADRCQDFSKLVFTGLLTPISYGIGPDELTIAGGKASQDGYEISFSAGKVGSLRSMVPTATPQDFEDYTRPTLCFYSDYRTVNVIVDFKNFAIKMEEFTLQTPHDKLALDDKEPELTLKKSTANLLVRINSDGTVGLDKFSFAIGSPELRFGKGLMYQAFARLINKTFGASIKEYVQTSGLEGIIQAQMKAAISRAVTSQQEIIYSIVPKF